MTQHESPLKRNAAAPREYALPMLLVLTCSVSMAGASEFSLQLSKYSF